METSDHDLLIRLDEKVDAILKRLEKHDGKDEELEKRIGRVESFQIRVIGIATGISIAVSSVGSQLGHFFGGGG